MQECANGGGGCTSTCFEYVNNVPTPSPTTLAPTTSQPTDTPTTQMPTESPTTPAPTTPRPTNIPTTPQPTDAPTTPPPSTPLPTDALCQPYEPWSCSDTATNVAHCCATESRSCKIKGRWTRVDLCVGVGASAPSQCLPMTPDCRNTAVVANCCSTTIISCKTKGSWVATQVCTGIES